MRYLVISDVHLGRKLFNLKELGKDIEYLYSQMVDEAINEKVDFFVSCGDLFDTNKPTAEEVKFVRDCNERLKVHGIVPLAISGDHSKHVSGVSWEQVCGFDTFDKYDDMIGIDYSDNPKEVLSNLEFQLKLKPDATKLFLHGQVPELWKFCEEKKYLNIVPILKNTPNKIDAVVLGDIHKNYETFVEPFYLGYCGSLGVTSINEIRNKSYKLIDGSVIVNINYDLPRLYKHVTISNKAEIPLFKELVQQEIYENKGARPVVVINYSDEISRSDLDPFNEFIAKGYIVHISKKIKLKDKKEEETLSLASLEQDMSKRFREVVNIIPLLTSDRTKDLLYEIVSDVDSAKAILDLHKEKFNLTE